MITYLSQQIRHDSVSLKVKQHHYEVNKPINSDIYHQHSSVPAVTENYDRWKKTYVKAPAKESRLNISGKHVTDISLSVSCSSDITEPHCLDLLKCLRLIKPAHLRL